MKATPLAIPDVTLLEPKVFGDDPGFFLENFNQAKFEAAIGSESVLSAKDQQGKSLAAAEPFA